MKRKFTIYIFLTLIIIGGFFIFINVVSAHSGGTDSYGCHTCYTNCSSYGLSSGEYHCHQSKGLPQPSYPIRSHDSGYSEPWPDYTIPKYDSYSYPSTPSCPTFSSYNSLSKSCECYSGYIADGNKCISTDTYCSNQFGYNAKYNILADSCECRSGYIVSGNSCVSGNTYCQNKYGYNSQYDSISENCECNYGYVLNANNQCVSENNYCQSLFGYNSKYNVLTDQCECSSDYIVNSSGNACISGDSYCSNKYGIWSQYDSLSKSCECSYGYGLNSSKTKCVSNDELCQGLLGYNAEYDSIYDRCACRNGYVLNSSKTDCINSDTYCSNLYGYNSSYDSLSKNCECDYGYELKNGECVEEEKKYETNPDAQPSIPIAPSPTPTYKTPEATQPKPSILKPNVVEVTKTDQDKIAKPEIKANKIENKEKSKNEIAATKTQEHSDTTFALIGNELLRQCENKDCPIVKWGSTNGSATILDKNDEWYKVIVSDEGSETEGWFNALLVPETIKKQYASIINTPDISKQNQVEQYDNAKNQETKGLILKIFKWISKWF